MAVATTYSLPNFTGELFSLTPDDTPFLSMTGGLTGGRASSGTFEHEWQAFDLREGSLRQRLEGANAPDSETRVRISQNNILEIHQEAVEVSYTKQAASQQLSGLALGGRSNPVANEMSFQLAAAIKSKALDIEYSFFNSQYHKPSTNATARRTRGLLEAIKTGINGDNNAVDDAQATLTAVAVTASTKKFASTAHGLVNGDQVVITGGEAGGFSANEVYYVVAKTTDAFEVAATASGTSITPTADVASVKVAHTAATALTDVDVLDLCQQAWQNGGLRESATSTVFVGASLKRVLTKEFITDAGYGETSRNVGGVNVRAVETDFGFLNIVLSRTVPKSALVVTSLEQCAPVFLEHPEKGVFFVEPLAKIGASDRNQLYGEIGLEYGNPLAHAALLNCKV